MPSDGLTLSCKILSSLMLIGSISEVYLQIKIISKPKDDDKIEETQDIFEIDRKSADNFITVNIYTSFIQLFISIIGTGIFTLCIYGILKQNEIYIKPALFWIPFNLLVALVCIAPLAYIIGYCWIEQLSYIEWVYIKELSRQIFITSFTVICRQQTK